MDSNDSVVDNIPIQESDIIPSLLDELTFKMRLDDEKIKIMEKGRPLPNLVIVKRDSTRNCSRTFQGSWYSAHKWLCGSKHYNKLFCWPCLLMRPESSSWCSTGNDDVKRLSALARKHSACKSHLKAIKEYDATLIGFGLLPEFIEETRTEIRGSHPPTNDSESEDYFDIYFGEDQKTKKTASTTTEGKLKLNSTEGSQNLDEKSVESKTGISFKSWREINRNAHPFGRTSSIEDKKLFKWRKKIARQELRNARLTGQKIKIEIELLRAKINQIKSGDSPTESPQTKPLMAMAPAE